MSTYFVLATTSNPKGTALANAVQQARTAFSVLQAESLRMAAMLSGDGSQDTHYAEIVTIYGVQQGTSASANAAARAMYNEINSAVGNSAALVQLMAELG